MRFVFGVKSAALWTWFALASAAQAHHCYIETPNINFGKVDPLRIEGTEAPAIIKLNCWSVTSPTHYCLTVKEGAAERILTYGTYEIPFNFYYNNEIFGNGDVGKPITGTIEPISGRPTQYPEILFSAKLGKPEGLSLIAGTYSGSFQTIVYGAYGKNSLTEAEKQAMCNGQRPAGTSYFTERSQIFRVSAKIEKSCSVVAGSLNFGRLPSLDKAAEINGAIRVKCSTKTDYQIGLSAGDNGGLGRRAMKCAEIDKCGARTVGYNLYHKENGSSGTIWNESWNTGSIVKGSSNNETQISQVYARINPDQPPPPAGTYSDRVVVTVRY